ncbi:hypothetical protein [Lentzea albidocapillata]|uniref:hypothetical protein n=1 Tax=Lentzea albidocapillata TaxID=40571 RepID=UPI00159F81D7|nr:hypothetical protein [Lentzea albidocapillata]
MLTDLDWTYISPADEIPRRTGTFRLGGDQMLTAADGSSLVSAEDVADEPSRTGRSSVA